MAKFEKRYFTSIAGFKDSAAGKPEPDPIVCLVYTAPDRGTYWFRDRT